MYTTILLSCQNSSHIGCTSGTKQKGGEGNYRDGVNMFLVLEPGHFEWVIYE